RRSRARSPSNSSSRRRWVAAARTVLPSIRSLRRPATAASGACRSLPIPRTVTRADPGADLAKPKAPAGLSLRLTAADRLQNVLKGASFSPLVSSDIADPRDRALANRLITTTLRYHGPINQLIGQL